jgi:hypothetical protein
LALAAVFTWKDSIPFLSSSAIAPTNQKEFRMQLPAGYTLDMYKPYVSTIIATKYPECLSSQDVSFLEQGENTILVRFVCLGNTPIIPQELPTIPVPVVTPPIPQPQTTPQRVPRPRVVPPPAVTPPVTAVPAANTAI